MSYVKWASTSYNFPPRRRPRYGRTDWLVVLVVLALVYLATR
jgi:hypothetical protein